MMSNEISLEQLNSLSPEERTLALEILKEISQEGHSELLDDLKYSDYEEIPVDIDTFLDDPQYLGQGLWVTDEYTGDRRCTVFPYWREVLKKIFPDNTTTTVNTVILAGAIGIGKTFCGVLIQLYLLYRMLCLKDPYSAFGMQPIDKITFSMMNITIEAAEGVGWSKLQELIQSSPWFMEHGNMNASRTNPQWQPPKGIELVFGSSNRTVVGRALFCLDGNTEVATTEGDKKLVDLVGKSINVISVDDAGNKTISNTCTVQPTIQDTTEYQIELEDGSVLKCTQNHRFLLKDGTYKEARLLTEADELEDYQPNAYLKFINDIIQKRGQWGLTKDQYFEGHHIIPKCFGGEGSTKAKHPNIIRLTAKEHFIVHKLLALEFPSCRPLVNAWNMMTHPKGKTKRDFEISPEDYAMLRELWSAHMKADNPGIRKTGRPWNYGLKKPKQPKVLKSTGGKKKKKAVTNGIETKYIAKSADVPEGYRLGMTIKAKKHIKDPVAYKQQKSRLAAGENNGMYGCGYKISYGKNGHATKNYYFEGQKYDCRKSLIEELNRRGYSVGNSTLRTIENKSYTDRLYKKFKYIIENLTWELKNEN